MQPDIPNGAKIYNVVRANMDQVYMNTLPSATKENIQSISNLLFNDAYTPMLNNFITNLINRIALTIVRNKSFNNPLNIFKKGSLPLGTDIQDIYENPANAEQYEYSNTAMAKLLSITDPDTHVAYYRRNRQDMYTKTIPREGLQGAFVSWDEFEKYVSSITTSLYSGNYIDEFKLTKALIDGAYDNNKVIVEQVTAPTDEASARAFIKKARAIYSKLKFPSTQYNAYSKFSGAKGEITTWTDEDRIVLITTSDVLAEVDVDVLARAFNIDNTKFLGRVIEVDKFDNPEIQAVICDESWIQIYDNLFRFDEFYNARVMAWNEYLHVWGTYAICPFANAIVLATALPQPANSINIGSNPIDLNLADVPNYETLTITLTPDNSTTDVEFKSTNDMVFTVKKNSNTSVTITPVNEGSAELQAKTDNGLNATATVNVTNSN